MNQNNHNTMRSPSSALSLLMAASLFICAPITSNASLPPDDTGQQVQQADQVTTVSSFAIHADQVAPLPVYTLQAVADSGFNPRTDFPTQPANVMTAGFGTLNMQECCGGNGSWNYAEQPPNRTVPYLAIVLFASMLLAATVHRVDKRRNQRQVLATH